ncbi:LOW QUALITY PROTEIN: hypothetical protein ACHAWF_005201 [Thalassiosira exigua]
MAGWEELQIVRHFGTKTHHDWEAAREKEGIQQSYLARYRDQKASVEQERHSIPSGTLTNADVEFNKEVVSKFLARGLPIYKLRGGLRRWLQESVSLRLSHRSELTAYVPQLLGDEHNLQRAEFRDCKQSIIFDATPRQGDLFALVSCSVWCNPTARQAGTRHRLIHVSTIKGSLNATSLSAEVNKGLMLKQIMHNKVLAAMVNRCFTNSAATTENNEAAPENGNTEWRIFFCFSHLACNAGNHAGFPLLDLFWKLLQKVFSHSTAAQDEWIEVAGTRHIGANASALLRLILDKAKTFQLKIELAASTEGYDPLRQLCYYLEDESSDLPFLCAEKIDKYVGMFPNGHIWALPSAGRLIMEAINWATTPSHDGGDGSTPDSTVIGFPVITCREISVQVSNTIARNANAPEAAPSRLRRASARGVKNATRALKSAQQRRQREVTEVLRAKEGAGRAAAEEAREAVLLSELEQAANSQADRPPLSRDEWYAHILSGMLPGYEYFLERISVDGDWYVFVEFFCGQDFFILLMPKLCHASSRPLH